MTDLPPAGAEYTSAHVVPGYGHHADLHAIELIGHADCWESPYSWSDPILAQRAANTLLSRSQRGIGA